MTFFGLPFLAATLTFLLPPGTAENPSAVFPLKPGEEPMAFAWDGDMFRAGDRTISWKEIGVVRGDGTKFKWKTKAADGEEILMDIMLKRSASRFAIPSMASLANRKLEGHISVTPAKAGTAKLQLVCRGPRSPILRNFRQAKAKAGETVRIPLIGNTTDLGALALTLSDIDGAVLFQPGGWGFRDPSLVFALRVLHTDRERQVMYIRSDNWFGKDTNHTLRVTMEDFDSGVAKWTRTVPALPVQGVGNRYYDGKREQPVDVKDLPPGQYKCVVTLVDGRGKDVASDYAFFAKPDGKAPWEGTTLGLEDTVPPPWTAPEFRDDTFTCWNRRMALGGKALVTSIMSGGQELLQAPVAMEVDGRPVGFVSRCARRGVSEADYELAPEDGTPVKVALRCEFDGMMWFDVTWKPPVKSIAVKIPVRRSLVTGFDDCSSAKEKLDLPPGKTCAFDYDPTHKPWWWLGNTVGLMGGTENFRGWRIKDTSRGYRLDVTADAAIVTMRFVDVPLDAGEQRTFGFYLEPTPVKPKNMAFASLPAERIVRWTGHVERFFEDKWPGRIVPEKFAPYAEHLKKGRRVFFYNGTKGVSAAFPWWGWYGSLWQVNGNPEIYSEEVPFDTRARKDRAAWTCGCPNVRNFLDYKIWSVCWLLHEPSLGVKDLYWDLAGPYLCPSKVHGCRWKDEFGNERLDRPVRTIREMHKRVYREMKKKNADGLMMGHLQFQRNPSDVFFDALVMGECYDRDICYALNYYDVLNPATMRLNYAARANEQTIVMLPQISRAMGMYAADRRKGYDPKAPENDRANRHATAYFKIHDLGVGGDLGGQWTKPDAALRPFGASRRHSAYYTGDCPVTVSTPSERFLYALYEGEGERKLLILLNDTDGDVSQTISVKGLKAIGKDIFSDEQFDFRTGACTFTLPPRESRFILFQQTSAPTP